MLERAKTGRNGGEVNRQVQPPLVQIDPPITWDEQHHLQWKTPIPGLGHSTPVIWGDHTFLTTTIPIGKKLNPSYSGASGAHDNAAITRQQDFVVLAISRKNGKILWQRSVRKQVPHAGGHVSGSLASTSPCTDGKQVYTFFGSYGLYALDFSGFGADAKQTRSWRRQFPHFDWQYPNR